MCGQVNEGERRRIVQPLDPLSGFFTADGDLTDAARAGYHPPLDGREEPWSNQDLLNEALSYASFGGHLEVVEFLLSRGADPTVTDTRRDATPSSWAEYRGHEQVVGILQAAEAARDADQ